MINRRLRPIYLYVFNNIIMYSVNKLNWKTPIIVCVLLLTYRKLFNGENFKYGNPLKQFHHQLKGKQVFVLYQCHSKDMQ